MSGVAAATVLLLSVTDALTHRGMRLYVLLIGWGVDMAGSFFRVPFDAWWRRGLLGGLVVLVLWVLLELVAAIGRAARRVQPPQQKPWWMPARPWGGPWEWLRSARLLRAASNVAVYAFLGLFLAAWAVPGAARAGRWAGEAWLGPLPGPAWVREDAGPLAPGTHVLVFIDGERVVERPVTTVPGREKTYFPCGGIGLRALGDGGLRLRLEKDFGSVVGNPEATQPCPPPPPR